MAAKAAPKKAPAKPKGKPVVDRFESDWDGVPNFKLKDAKKAPAKKK